MHDGRVVKGVNFLNLRDAGDPVELARLYGEQGADELTFLDISASSQGRETTYEMVTRTAETVFIPLTVGGGVRGVDDVDRLLRAGADKVGINTGAIARPELVDEIADRFGNQVLVLSLDARREAGTAVRLRSDHARRTPARRAWTPSSGCREAVDRGAGEILLNSMDADGTTDGFDLEMIEAVRCRGRRAGHRLGRGRDGRALRRRRPRGADAVLAASVFHYGTLSIAEVKAGLAEAGFEVRTEGALA